MVYLKLSTVDKKETNSINFYNYVDNFNYVTKKRHVTGVKTLYAIKPRHVICMEIKYSRNYGRTLQIIF